MEAAAERYTYTENAPAFEANEMPGAWFSRREEKGWRSACASVCSANFP